MPGGGGGQSKSHPHSPKMRILPQNRWIWAKSPFPHVTVGPQSRQGIRCGGQMTSADLGVKVAIFPPIPLTSGFSKKPF